MITIKFPKSPRTLQRRKVQEIGKKYDYWYDPIKLNLRIIELLEKIEQNTRK